MEPIKYNVTIYDLPAVALFTNVTEMYYENGVLNFTDCTGKETIIRTDKWLAKEV